MNTQQSHQGFHRRQFLSTSGLIVLGMGSAEAIASELLPDGVEAVWDLAKAQRDTTPTRERACLNGLWRWQPGKQTDDSVPTEQWGYFKVPGFWPGNASYIQEDCQTLYAHPAWKHAHLPGTTAAWYQRDFTIPENWTGRRIVLNAEYVNSLGIVYVDGKQVGVIRFPAGEVDLNASCRPGSKHVLSLLVMALPLKAVLLSYTDTNSARKMKGPVERRGLCGDVYLASTPAAARIADVKVDTSVRRGELSIRAALEGVIPNDSYALHVGIQQHGRTVREFTSKTFRASDLRSGRIAVSERWKPEKLWDIHTPENVLTAQVMLFDAAGKLVDEYYPERFGFRELWIEGRDFFLNGTRIHLSAVPLDNAQLGARSASYEGTRETLKRLQSFGINLVYTHNYGCEPGSHISFAEVLRAADDAGMLVAFSQPHFSHYDWKDSAADSANGYARHAAFYVRAAQNHPSVVAYSMSHNATGYEEDMNPDLIDGIHDPRSDRWSRANARLARRAEAIVRALDPTRIVYHHASGNLGSMHAINFYLNFVPAQEISDWFEHWATQGVKPVFPCEYGVPFTWDWTMYRGWYRGRREWGSAAVPWEFCLAEWNAQFEGDRAYQISEAEKQNLRWEARQFRSGRLWHRWDYPHPVGSSDFREQQEVLAGYISDNWRAHRTWGVSAISPWEYGAFWTARPGFDTRRMEFEVAWEHLQRPGFSPDYDKPRRGWMSVDGKFSDWLPTAAGQALIRNNRPLLAYIAGDPSHFTSKDHTFHPGGAVSKQLIIINDSRAAVSCHCAWSIATVPSSGGESTISVPAGDQARLPVHLHLPAALPTGKHTLTATARFSTGETTHDTFTVHVLPRPNRLAVDLKIALFDPKGETAELLTGLDTRFHKVEATADLSGYDVLTIGKEALSCDGPGPDISRVRDGLKVIVFEQAANVLEQRLGFRVAEYGLRQVFRRIADHPLLAGLEVDYLRDWRGEATLLPPRLKYRLRPRYGPTVKWCGIDVPRAWRMGCRGNVASVLIEKPARGDFLPILDGGYGLQYAPLLEYREGKGMVLFCQMDVTGRTEREPAADILTRNVLAYVSGWKPRPRREAMYVGEPAGKRHLGRIGVSVVDYVRDRLGADRVLIVGPGGGKQLSRDAAALGKWLSEGGHLLAVGLDQADADALLPIKVTMKNAEHIATYFEPPSANSFLAGTGPADVHNRDPRELPLVAAGAKVLGKGILAHADNANIVFCQLVPWQFDFTKQMNLKRTFRRAAVLLSRLAANMGTAGPTPLLARFRNPVEASRSEKRWLEGLYLDVPEEWDDPYRFFRW